MAPQKVYKIYAVLCRPLLKRGTQTHYIPAEKAHKWLTERRLHQLTRHLFPFNSKLFGVTQASYNVEKKLMLFRINTSYSPRDIVNRIRNGKPYKFRTAGDGEIMLTFYHKVLVHRQGRAMKKTHFLNYKVDDEVEEDYEGDVFYNKNHANTHFSDED